MRPNWGPNWDHAELVVPARVYLFKDGRPFRLSPVQAMLPLRVDLFYREALAVDGFPDVLEVTCNDQSHFFLLKRPRCVRPSRRPLSSGDYACSTHRLKRSSTFAPEKRGAFR